MAIAPTRVIVGDDNPVFTRGLAEILSDAPEIDLVDVARDRDTLLASVGRHQPDLLLTDLRMPPTMTDEGLQVVRRARASQPDLSAIVLTQFTEPEVAHQLLSDGERGIGYLLKDRIGEPRELVSAIQLVARGGTAIDPSLVQALMQQAAAGPDPLGVLTRTERDVLRLVAEGLSNEGIAERLSIGRSAVEKHVSSIFRKLPLEGDDGTSTNRRVRATLYYLDHSLAEEDPA